MINAKLNKEFLEQYKPVFTDQLIQQAFDGKDYLDGKDILKLTPIRQFNLFILKALFTKWQEEMKKLESPYFDFKDPEVRKSMVEFMNLLSQKIKIQSEDLRPLIFDALEDTCTLAISPSEYVRKELKLKNVKNLTGKTTRQLLKYLAIHKKEIESLLKEQEGNSIPEVLNTLQGNFTELDTESVSEDLATKLSDVLVVNKSDLILHDISLETEDNIEVVQDVDSVENPDIDPEVMDEEVSEDTDSSPTEHEEIMEPEQASSELPTTEGISEETEDDIPESDEETAKTLNDTFEVEAKTLADIHEEKAITSIMDSISINHKYMFLQELFDGDNEAFSKAIEEVEACNSFDESVEMLVQSYAKEYEWDMNSDEVKELLKVIFRKFR